MKIKVYKNEIICKIKRLENRREKKKNLKKRKNKQLNAENNVFRRPNK